MDKETIKSFIRWLERASDEEIMSRTEEGRAAYKKVSSRETRGDLNLALRLIDEAWLARMNLRRRQSPKWDAPEVKAYPVFLAYSLVRQSDGIFLSPIVVPSQRDCP